MNSLCILLLALLPGQADTQKQLEAEFERALSGVAFVGHFTADDAPDRAPTAERYEITKITKLQDNYWRFVAKIEYGTRSVSLPLDLEVEWAGDTPVITLTDFQVMGMGTFTARVVVYRGRYAGTWQGATHGGHLFGVIEPLEGASAGDAGDDKKQESEGAQGDGSVDAGSSDSAAAVGILSASALRLSPSSSDKTQNWPSFRGPSASGVVDGYETPVEWDVDGDQNISWKTAIPGMAHSSPVIWGDHIFLTTAVKEGQEAELQVGLFGSIEPVADEGVHQMRVLCVDKRSGKVLWSQVAFEGVPEIKRHPKGSHAASSPATDGRCVVAFFGSEGLYCYDTDGKLRWKKSFGRLDSSFYLVPTAQWGFASSPVIFEDKVLVECDVIGESFIAALDVATGEELWRTARDEVPTWSTPTVHVSEGRRQVIVNGMKHLGGYDVDSGKELWNLVGGGDIPVPTPIVADDVIYLTNAHGTMAPIYAVHASAEGIVSMSDEGKEHMAWAKRSRGNYMQTPIVYGPYLFCCSDSGVLTCYDRETGEEIFRERLGGGGSGFTASIVASDGKLYVTAEAGEIYVLPAGAEFEILSVNDMGEECMASPAVSEGTLFWRGRRHLFAVAQL
ncbi:MAG: outer membrane protein assembly factor BamB [Chlamydiales bacterium]|jgi:outer membrane protein assembly factor BamB